MRLIGGLVCVAAILCGIGWFLQTRDQPHDVTYCRVRFGDLPTEILLGRSSDDLLIFRSGKPDSTPERIHLEYGCLPDGTTIPPIIATDGTSYLI
jgi:hypothetical protein